MPTDGIEAAPPAPRTESPPPNPFGRGLEDPATPRPPPSFNIPRESSFGSSTRTDPIGFGRTMSANGTQFQLSNPLGNPDEVTGASRENTSAPPAFNLGSLPLLALTPRHSSRVSQGPVQSPVPPSFQQQAATQTQMGPPQATTRNSVQPILGLAVGQRSIAVPVTSSNQPGLPSSNANGRIQNWLEDVFVDPNDQYSTPGIGGRNAIAAIDPHPFAPTLQEVAQNAIVSAISEQRGRSLRRTSAPTRPSPPSSNALARLTDTKMPPRQPPPSPLKNREGSNSQEDDSTEPQTPRNGNRTFFSSVEEAEAYSDIHGGGSKIVQTPRGDISVFTPKRRPSQPMSKVVEGEDFNGVALGSMATEGLATGNLDSSQDGIGSPSGILNQVDNTRAMTDTYWGIRPAAPPVRHPAGPSSPTPRSVPARSPSPIPRRGSTSSIPPTSSSSSSSGLQESSPTHHYFSTPPQLAVQPTPSPIAFPMPSLDINNSPPTIQLVNNVGNPTTQPATESTTETAGSSHATPQTYTTYFADEIPPFLSPTDTLPDLVPSSTFPERLNTHPQHSATVTQTVFAELPPLAGPYLLTGLAGEVIEFYAPPTPTPATAAFPVRQPTAVPTVYLTASSTDDGVQVLELGPGEPVREPTSAPIVHEGATSVPPVAGVVRVPVTCPVSEVPLTSSAVASRASEALVDVGSVIAGDILGGGSEQATGVGDQSEESTQGQARAEEETLWEVFGRREWLADGVGGEVEETEEAEEAVAEAEESGNGNDSWMVRVMGLLRRRAN